MRRWNSSTKTDTYKSRQRDLNAVQKPQSPMPSVSSSTVDIGLGYTIVIAVGRTEQMRSLKIESSERLLTTEEAAEYLRKPKQSLLNMVSQGKLTQLKLGRMNRYKFSELNQLLLTENKEGENV